MSKNEVVVRIVDAVVQAFAVDPVRLRELVEDVLYDYDITAAQRALVVQNDMTEKILLYLASRKIDGLSERTLETYQRYLGKFAMALRKNVEDITTMDIRRYLAYYAQTGVKNTTIALIVNTLRGFFKWLEDEEYIQKSPVRKIKSIKLEKRLRKPLTHEELEVLRDACRTYRQRALLEFFYATGCRLEEVEKLNKSDIDWQQLKLTVIGKGDKERTVYLNSKAKVHLQKYLMSRLDGNEALFVTSKQPIKRLGRRSIEREFKAIEKRAKLDKSIYPHLVRHTMATHILNSGADLGTVQALLGHEDASTTQIYAQISNTNVEHAYRKHMIQ